MLRYPGPAVDDDALHGRDSVGEAGWSCNQERLGDDLREKWNDVLSRCQLIMKIIAAEVLKGTADL